MRSTRQRDTGPEVAVRSAIYALGLRYRLQVKVLANRRRTVDIAFRRARVAVFVDGCFWHSCPKHGTSPKANSKWWSEKLEVNRERDADTNRELRAMGWKVIRIWEHENPEIAAKRVGRAVQQRLRATP